MSFLLLGALALAALVAVIVAVGFLLPERYEGAASYTYDAPPEDVWTALMDYERHPMTGHMARGFEALPEANGQLTWIEEMQGERITVTTIEAQPPERLVREMTSAAVPMSSRWDYTLEPAGSGSCLTIEGVTHIRRGTFHVPLFRVMMVIGGGVKKGLDTQLEMLAETLKASQPGSEGAF